MNHKKELLWSRWVHPEVPLGYSAPEIFNMDAACWLWGLRIPGPTSITIIAVGGGIITSILHPWLGIQNPASRVIQGVITHFL